MKRLGILSIALLAAAPLVAPQAAQSLRPFEMADMHRLQDLSGPSFSPDGERIAYTVSGHNLDSDASVSDLWRANWSGGAPVQLTNTQFDSEWAPAYSPDGKWLAFLGDGSEDGSAQIFVMPAAGGEARQVSRLPAGVNDFVWAPDSRRFALIAEDAPPPVRKDSRGEDKPVPPLVIDRFQFMEDGRDYLTNRYQRLWTLSLDGEQLTQLTRAPMDVWLPSWSPDGASIAYVTRTGPDPDRHLNYDVYTVAPEAGTEPKRISSFAGTDVDPYWESRPVWSPDGKQLAWLQSGEDKWIYYAPWQLVVADLEKGTERKLAHIDRSFYKPRWSPDGKAIYALVEQNLNTWLARIDVASEKIDYLSQGQRFGYDYALAPNGRLAELVSTDTRPFFIESVEAKPRTLADHNSFLNQVQLQASEELRFDSEGHNIEALLVKPVGYQPGKKYPTIVRVHGGPVYQFSHEFMYDWQLYAAAGYAVLAVNPRGSSGRGFDFSRAIYASWGEADVKDVLAGVDHLVDLGIADKERLGLGGWSYGGILTNFLIGSDTRFKAAISGAGVANVLGSYGHDQYSREYELELGTPWENFDNYARVSYPFLHADRITTPTLYQCAEKDRNVPCLGAEQMYQALRSLKVDSQLVIYPGQNHGLNVPSYLADRMQRNLDWYGQYLLKKRG
ncbi:S9 family peptidase [Microbulbifer sp.]|uniref:S9 family peptidase n=1 Tax=Microbulbifer sp. TaxID=1908541 RepID=UPI002F939B66